MQSRHLTLALGGTLLAGGLTHAQQLRPMNAGGEARVRVTFESLVPEQGNFFTPFFSGFHDGSFDIWTSGVPASGPGALVPGDALERLAEDGDTSVMMAELLASGAGVVTSTLPGPNGPVAPGDFAAADFLLDPLAPTSRYFSWASMVLPSNDAFVANGSPVALPVFDAAGNFLATRDFETGMDFADAGTEVNDEVPANTAFFGQAAPNTGVDEGGVVVSPHPGFNPAGSGGILDDARFSESLFNTPGYPALKIRIEAAPAVTEFRSYAAVLSGGSEVPAVDTPASGIGLVLVTDEGTKVRTFFRLFNTQNVIGAHLHRAPVGENGPIVADLIDPAAGDSNPFPLAPGGGAFPFLTATLDSSSLAGPLNAFPLDALAGAMDDDVIYVNVHTSDGDDSTGPAPGDFMSGELRGQLTAFP